MARWSSGMILALGARRQKKIRLKYSSQLNIWIVLTMLNVKVFFSKRALYYLTWLPEDLSGVNRPSKRVTVNRQKHNIITVNRQMAKEKIRMVMEKITAKFASQYKTTGMHEENKIELRLKISWSNHGQLYF